LPNAIERLIEAADRLLSADADHGEPLGSKPSIAPQIMLSLAWLLVGRPVNLDDEPRREAHEIGDIGADRHLSLELHAFEALCSQRPPHKVFDSSFFAAL
jgi:hypothetical protein